MKLLVCLMVVCLFAGVHMASLSGCPGGLGTVYCFVDPCMNAHCPAHPSARCVSNYCGGCNAEFYDAAGNLVLDCNHKG